MATIAQTATPRPEAKADLSEVVSRYRRHVPTILLATLLGGVALGALTFVIPPRYTATAEMTYAPQSAPDVRSVSVQPSASISDAARTAHVNADVQAIGSLAVAERVVDGLQLTRDLELVKKAQRYNTLGDLRGAVAMVLLDGLKVREVGETMVIDVAYTSKDPLMSARIANAFAQAYTDQQQTDNLALSSSNLNRMDGTTQTLAQQARDADARVAQFKLSHHMVFDPNSPNIGTDIGYVTQSLAEARGQLAEAAARARFVNAGGMNDTLSTNSALTPLLDQQAQVSRELATLQARYGARHPKVQEAQRELQDINQGVRQESARQADDARAAVGFAQQKVASLQASLAQAKGEQIEQVAAGTQLLGLQRQAETANLLYNNMLANAGQEAAKRSVMPPDTTLTAPADPPMRPSFPILPLDVVVGLLLGAAFGIGIAYVRERWSVGISSNDDIERMLGKTFLNSLPTLNSAVEDFRTTDPVGAIIQHPLSLYTEAYRSLATNLRLSGPNVKTIAVTSALPKEGKTTCAINMARALAMSGERVVLVDCDLRRRSVTKTLLPDAQTGLVEVVRGQAPLGEAMHVDETGMHLLPLAPNAHEGGQPFGTANFNELMATLRRNYDVVVLDTPPVLAVVDVRLLLDHVDALGLLVHWRKTPVRAVRAAIHQIETVGGEICGVAMSMVDVNAQMHVGYGDASQYYSVMKEYYHVA